MFRRRLASDQGSILPLIIGGCALALALALGVSTATSLYLERKRLLTIADGAALVAAQSFDLSLPPTPTPAVGGTLTPRLSVASVNAGATKYFASLTPATLRGATIAAVSSPDSRTAVVRVRATWQPPVVSFFFPKGFVLEASSSARSVFN